MLSLLLCQTPTLHPIPPPLAPQQITHIIVQSDVRVCLLGGGYKT